MILLWGVGLVVLSVVVCAVIRLFTKRVSWGEGSVMLLMVLFIPYTALCLYGAKVYYDRRTERANEEIRCLRGVQERQRAASVVLEHRKEDVKRTDAGGQRPKIERHTMSDLWEQGYEDGYEDGYFYEDYERHRSDDLDYEDGYEQGFHDGRVESGADGFWDD